jgi:hypothetical protein
MSAARRNQSPRVGLISEPDFGGDMSTTDKSILEKIASRIKEIVRIAEDAASHAMRAEQPPRANKRANKRVSDPLEN